MVKDILNILLRIMEEGTDPDSLIASTILKHVKQMPTMKNKELAELCFVDRATITRFIQKLGFNSYIEFKDWFRNGFNNIDYDLVNQLQLEDIVDLNILSLKRTKQLIDQEGIESLVNDLFNYDSIILAGGRYSQLVCQDLQMRLLSVGKYTETFKDQQLQYEHMKQNPNGLLIQFSASFTHRAARETIKAAQESNYKIILVTQLGKTIEGSDETIYFHDNPKNFSVNSMEDRLCMLTIVDMIFLTYLKKLQKLQ